MTKIVDIEKFHHAQVHHVDHISEPNVENDKCKLLNVQLPTISSGFSGGGTDTAAALNHAKVNDRLCDCILFRFFFHVVALTAFRQRSLLRIFIVLYDLTYGRFVPPTPFYGGLIRSTTKISLAIRRKFYRKHADIVKRLSA